MKPGDRVIWIRSPGRSFLTGWRVERITAVIVRVRPKRLRICFDSHGVNRIVTVHPDNVLDEQADCLNGLK